MKFLKVVIILLLFLTLPALAEKLEGKVEFDWVNISQKERNTLIEQYKNEVLEPNPDIEFSKDAIQNKDKDLSSYETYGKIKSGINEDKDKIMVAFFFHDLFIAYGIIEKTNLKNTYYYNAMGNLKYIDFMAKDYGDYPYVANQYNKNGKLIARIYNASKYDQFMYSPEGKFTGRWYEDKLYNKKGKMVSTRSDY